MGGMLALEYAYFGPEFVRTIVPIATASRHSAWGISWGEAQRQSIYCDPKYDDGYYTFEDPPSTGLGAARMSALLTYRSRDSFESRFGRNIPDASRKQSIKDNQRPTTPSNEHWAVHNDGHKNARASRTTVNMISSPSPSNTSQTSGTASDDTEPQFSDPQFHGTTRLSPSSPSSITTDGKRATTYFSAQSYLRYQGEKFVKRFDGNCYIAITRKLDTHDVSRHRVAPDTPDAVAVALSQIQQPALVLGIQSDGLFTFAEQQQIANAIPDSRLRTINSAEGHDAFLLQFEQVNHHILEFFNDKLSDIMTAPVPNIEVDGLSQGVETVMKNSTCGEAEPGDMTEW